MPDGRSSNSKIVETFERRKTSRARRKKSQLDRAGFEVKHEAPRGRPQPSELAGNYAGTRSNA
jgi:hypothetical protein